MPADFAIQSSLPEPPPFHVAIIMDGNGRWARARGLSRPAGHREGGRAVRRVVEAAPELGITTLTLYAFSSDNWQRPAAEVSALMELFERYLGAETGRCVEQGVRLRVIGRRDRLRPRLRQAIEEAEARTGDCRRLDLRLAVDYSARESIARAARACRLDPPVDAEAFARVLGEIVQNDPDTPDVDLLIRTSGEQRLSDFLLWEVAYAELVFVETAWPDFDGACLSEAVKTFRRRNRRFGRLDEGQA